MSILWLFYIRLLLYSRCRDTCEAGGFSYYGLVWGNQCSCGNSIGGESIDEGECDTPCVGDASQMCGGYGAANPTVLYQIGGGNAGTAFNWIKAYAQKSALSCQVARKISLQAPRWCLVSFGLLIISCVNFV